MADSDSKESGSSSRLTSSPCTFSSVSATYVGSPAHIFGMLDHDLRRGYGG